MRHETDRSDKTVQNTYRDSMPDTRVRRNYHGRPPNCRPPNPIRQVSIQKYMQKVQMWVWHSALFARHSPNYEKNILKIFANLLSSLWLNDAPSAYSFCNLDLHPITA